MSILGGGGGGGDIGPEEGTEQPTPSEPPPDDWNAQFTAIVSGISGGMHWQVSEPELDAAAGTTGEPDRTILDGRDVVRWRHQEPDTAEARQLRRELRRQQRAEELALFLEEQARREAEFAADTEHFVPPPPPPLPRLRRRTVGALLLLVLGGAFLALPGLLPVTLEWALVLSIGSILAGGAILAKGLRHQHREGWDDGAEV